jgi:hypothetical protein
MEKFPNDTLNNTQNEKTMESNEINKNKITQSIGRKCYHETRRNPKGVLLGGFA